MIMESRAHCAYNLRIREIGLLQSVCDQPGYRAPGPKGAANRYSGMFTFVMLVLAFVSALSLGIGALLLAASFSR
jgi:hypothetical protein